MSIIVAILALGFIIFFHELGHFLAAKLFSVGVLEFSIGMGPRIFSKVFRNTRYSLKLLPLGGSCAMLGEDSAGSGDFSTPKGKAVENKASDSEEPEASASENEENSEAEEIFGKRILSPSGELMLDYDGVRFLESELPMRSFQNKPNWQRFIICIAGVFNNMLLAFFLALVVCHFSGFDVPVIMGTESGAAVSEAGLSEGDILKSISYDGRHKREIHSFRDLYVYLYLNSSDFKEDTRVEIEYLRGKEGERLGADFTPLYDAAAGKYRLGISFYGGKVLASSAPELFRYAYYELHYNVRVVLDSLRMLGKGRVQRNEVMGPVGAVSVIGNTVQQSSAYGLFNAFLVLLQLSTMLSANLGVMNLLPIPALDGGRLLFILLEMISHRRLNPEIENKINQFGMVLLLVLMALILSNDVFNLLTGAYSRI